MVVLVAAGNTAGTSQLRSSPVQKLSSAENQQLAFTLSGMADSYNEGVGGAQNRSLLLLAGDVELNPGPVWVQYALYHKGENEKVGEALMKLEDQWQSVPREALANWLKHVLLNEVANTLVRVDAILVNLEMPLGTQATNDSIHECMSDGFVNIAIVAPRPAPVQPPQPALPHPPQFPTTSTGPQDVVLDSPAFSRQWQPATAVVPVPHFTNPPPGLEGAGYTSATHALALRPLNGVPKTSPASYALGEKRKRQEKWTEHETLVLIAAKQQEDEEHLTAAEGDRLKTAAERWNRTADLMRSKGVLDREGKNCEDKITNLKKDWGKIKDWNVSHGGVMRYWELSITDRKLNKLPVNMSEAVYTALDEMEEKRLRHRHMLPPHPDTGMHTAEVLHSSGGMHSADAIHVSEALHDAETKFNPEAIHSAEGSLEG